MFSPTSRLHRLLSGSSDWPESVLLKYKTRRHSGPHPTLTSDSKQEQPPLVLPTLLLLLGKKNFPLLTAPTFIWNPGGYHIKEVSRESLRNGPLGRVPWDWVQQQVQARGPRLVAKWWNWEVCRARQEVSPEETACLSMQVSRHLGAVSGSDLVVEGRVPN